jgi:hypothetical protein
VRATEPTSARRRRGVRRVLEALLLGDDAELHLQSDGHTGLIVVEGSPVRDGGIGERRPGRSSRRSPRDGWQVWADYTRGPHHPERISVAAIPPGAAANAESSSSPGAAAPAPRSARRPRHQRVEALEPDDPAGSGCGRHPLGHDAPPNVAIARASRSSSSSPSARAASGRRSPRVGPGGERGRSRTRGPGSFGTPTRTCAVGCRRTSHGVAAARRAGSRSSSVVVVTNACGSACDPADEVRPPGRVELGEDVVEEEERRAPVERREQVQLGELEGEDRRPLLTARCERGEVAARPARRRQVVTVWADEGRAVPDLLLGRLGQTGARGRRAGDSPGSRRVGHVAEAVSGVDSASSGRSRRALGQRLRERLEQAQSLADDPAPGVEQRRSQNRSSARSRRPRGSRGAGCSAAGAPGRTWRASSA